MFKLGNKDIERVHINGVDRHFFINGVIEDDEDYIDLIDALYQSKPSDNIYIHLNTVGGNLDITMQILNAIKASEANVVGIADGVVASAGTLLLFSCPNISIMPYSYIMMHDGSEGAKGKLNENLKQALFSAKLIKKLYTEIYGLFFTPKEINSILDGQDMWLTSEEVVERIQKYADQKEKEMNEQN